MKRKTPSDKDLSPNHNEQKAKRRQNATQAVSVAELNQVTAAIERYDAKQKQQARREQWKLGIEIATLVVLATYTLLTGLLVRQTQTAMALDQRAWVGVYRYTIDREPVTSEPFNFKLWLANTGKTPALELTDKGAIFIGPNEPTRSFEELGVQTGTSHTTLFPTGTTSLYSVDHGREGIPAEIATAYRERRHRFYILGRIEYRDIFGKDHWTEVCASRAFGDPLDQFLLCSKRNMVDH